MSPAQGGLPVTTGEDAVSVLPQLSVTVGGVGAAAAAGHATVDAVLAGIVTIGAATVVVCVQV
jgi:hypothetical protein